MFEGDTIYLEYSIGQQYEESFIQRNVVEPDVLAKFLIDNGFDATRNTNVRGLNMFC